MFQIVQRGDNAPAVHLALVELLRAVIKPGGIAETNGVGRREQAEIRIRLNHAILIEQRQLAARLQDALDDEHHIRTPGIIFIKRDGDRALQRPWQDAFAKLGDLRAIFQHDGILADHIDPRHVAVQIDPDHRPIEAGRNLLDMGRLTGAVIPLHHDPAIVFKARQQRDRGLRIKAIGVIDRRNIFRAILETVDDKICVEAEHLTDIDLFGRLQALQGVAIAHHSHANCLSSSLFKAHLSQPARAPSVTLGEALRLLARDWHCEHTRLKSSGEHRSCERPTRCLTSPPTESRSPMKTMGIRNTRLPS